MAGTRQANPIDLQLQPGLFMQRSVRQALNRYTNGDNVRWYRGLPQKMGGFKEIALVDTNGNRVFYKGHARSYHQWDSLDGNNWIAFGTELKLYLINNGTLYDITPIRASTTVTNGFTTVTGSLIVNVLDVSHGAQTGDFVTYTGSTPVGNANFNQEFQILTVIDADNYQIVLAAPASTSATGGGGAPAPDQPAARPPPQGAPTPAGDGGHGGRPHRPPPPRPRPRGTPRNY